MKSQLYVKLRKTVYVAEIVTQKMIGTTIIMLRNTTRKCGKIERLIVGYLRRQTEQGDSIRVEEIVENFKSKKIGKSQFFDALRRLEKRYIIRLVSNPFSLYNKLERADIVGNNL